MVQLSTQLRSQPGGFSLLFGRPCLYLPHPCCWGIFAPVTRHCVKLKFCVLLDPKEPEIKSQERLKSETRTWLSEKLSDKTMTFVLFFHSPLSPISFPSLPSPEIICCSASHPKAAPGSAQEMRGRVAEKQEGKKAGNSAPLGSSEIPCQRKWLMRSSSTMTSFCSECQPFGVHHSICFT